MPNIEDDDTFCCMTPIDYIESIRVIFVHIPWSSPVFGGTKACCLLVQEVMFCLPGFFGYKQARILKL